jgi:hypothetical protein
MPAHAQITDVIKENYTCRAIGISRPAQKRTHHYIGSPRFVYHGGTEAVILPAKAIQSVGYWTFSEFGTATHN